MDTAQPKLKVLCYSANPVWEDANTSLQKIEEDLNRYLSKYEVPDLIILPEMFATGFSMNTKVLTEQAESITLKLNFWAKHFNCAFYGSLACEEAQNFKNRGLFICPNSGGYSYDKVHLFSYSGEDSHFSSGTESRIVECKGWKILLNICYDLRFPISIFNKNLNGETRYDLYLNVASWPSARIAAWETLLKARAIENQAYAVGCNRTGTDGNGLIYPESSLIIDYLGNTIQASSDNGIFQSATLDYDELQVFRKKYPFIQDERAEFLR